MSGIADAIVFGIGGTNEGLRAVMNNSEQVVKQSAGRINESLKRIGGEEGFEGMLAGERKVKNNMANISAAILSGGNAADVASAAFVGLAESMKIGLGAAVGVAIFDKIFEAVSKDIEHIEKLNLQLDKLDQRSRAGAGGRSSAQISSDLSSAQGYADEALDNAQGTVRGHGLGRGLLDQASAVFGFYENLATGNLKGALGSTASSIQDERAEQQKRSLEEIASFKEQQGSKEEGAADAAETGLSGSSREAALMKVRREFADRIATATNAGPGQNAALIDPLNREQAAAETQINRSASDAHADRRRQLEISADMERRDYTPVSTAQINYTAAQDAAQGAGNRTDEEKEAAQVKLAQAKEALEAAQQEQQVLDATAASEMRVASFRGSAAQEQREALEESVSTAESLLNVYKDQNEAVSRQLSLVKARKALEQFETQQALERIANGAATSSGNVGLMFQRAGIGAGNTVKQRLSLQSGVEQARIANNAAQDSLNLNSSTRNDEGLKQKANESATALAKAEAQIADFEAQTAISRRENLETAEAENTALQEAIAGNKAIGDFQKQQLDLEHQIQEARRDGNSEQAEALEKRKQLLQQQYAASIVSGPVNIEAPVHIKTGQEIQAEARARRDNAAKVERATKRFNDNGGLIGVNRDADGLVTGGIDPNTGRHVSRTKPSSLHDRVTADPDWLNQFKQKWGGKGTNAQAEMQQKQTEAQAAQKQKDAETKANQHSGTNLEAMASDMASMRTILEAWK